MDSWSRYVYFVYKKPKELFIGLNFNGRKHECRFTVQIYSTDTLVWQFLEKYIIQSCVDILINEHTFVNLQGICSTCNQWVYCKIFTSSYWQILGTPIKYWMHIEIYLFLILHYWILTLKYWLLCHDTMDYCQLTILSVGSL